MQAGEPLNAINLNIVNLTFLLLGFLLHKTPARLMHAVQGATPGRLGRHPPVPVLCRHRGHHYLDRT